MELLELLKDFGLPGIFIGILILMLRSQAEYNRKKEERFEQERIRQQQREDEYFKQALESLQRNTEVIARFSQTLDYLQTELQVVSEYVKRAISS